MKHAKVLEGLEKLANAEGYALLMKLDRIQGEWVITFSAGDSFGMMVKLTSFCIAPEIVLDPFLEEMIKRLK